ncbi:MAG: hypothetical protein KGI51_04830 [Rhodospirillales bacterium]|nr:hypothetical protein [Rhodospirillales bacterium]
MSDRGASGTGGPAPRSAAQDAWIARVLGLAPRAAPPSAPQAAASAPKSDLDAKIAAAAKLLIALKAHPQHAHIADKIAEAEAELAVARTDAAASREKEGEAALATAEATIAGARRLADRFAEIVTLRASTTRAVNALKDFLNATAVQQLYTAIAAAFAKAAPPGRAYDQAKQGLDAVLGQQKQQITVWFITPMRTRTAALAAKVAELERSPETAAGGSVAQPDLDAARTYETQAEAKFAAGKWAEAIMTARNLVGERVVAGSKIADRRLAYDKARAATAARIAALTPRKTIAIQVDALEKLLLRADGLASRQSMRMEDAIAELRDLDQTCAALEHVAADAEAYARERQAADARFEALKKSPAVGELAPQIAEITKLLAASRQAAGAAMAR